MSFAFNAQGDFSRMSSPAERGEGDDDDDDDEDKDERGTQPIAENASNEPVRPETTTTTSAVTTTSTDPEAQVTTTTTTTTSTVSFRRKMVASLFSGVSSGLTIGALNYSFGVFVASIAAEYPQFTRTEISTAFSVAQITSGVVSPLAGHLIDKYTVRIIVPLSLIIFGSTGFAILAASDSLASLYAAYALLGISYPASAMLSPGKVVGELFPKREKGRMMGFITALNNVGGLVCVQIATAIANSPGTWRWSAGTFAVSLAVLSLVYPFAVIRHPKTTTTTTKKKKNGSTVDGTTTSSAAKSPATITRGEVLIPTDTRTTLRRPSFHIITIGCACLYWTYSGVLSQLIPALLAEGLDSNDAANAVSVVAALGVVSKLFAGVLSEYITARRSLQLSALVQAGSMFLFCNAPNSGALWASCAIFGLSFGAVGALLPLTVIEVYGAESFGVIYGVQLLFFIIPAVVSPIVAGHSFDTTGNYRQAFYIAGGLFLASIIFIELAARVIRWEIRRATQKKSSAEAASPPT